MGARLYRDKFSCRVYSFKIYGKLPYLGQSFIYKRFSEMPHIKENTPVNTPPALNLLLLCPRYHITAGEFQNLRGISFHKPLPSGIQKIPTLAPCPLTKGKPHPVPGFYNSIG